MRRLAITAVTIGCGVLLAACAAGTTTTSAATGPPAPTGSMRAHTPSSTEAPVPTEQPVPTESNPPGDIPDNTQFVPYHAKAGWTVSVPEGWARSTSGTTVTFTDKLNTVQVDAQPGAKVTLAGVKHEDVHRLAASARAFALQSVTTAHLPAGPTVLISYQANSDPNPVTGKQYRLDVCATSSTGTASAPRSPSCRLWGPTTSTRGGSSHRASGPHERRTSDRRRARPLPLLPRGRG